MVKMGDVWDRTIAFLGDHLSTILPIALFAIFAPSCISGSLADVQVTTGMGVRMALGLIPIAFAILSLWGQLAIVALAIDPAIGGNANRVATARLLPAIGVYVVAFMIAFVVFGGQAMLFAFLGGYDLGQISMAGQTMQRLALPPQLGRGVAILLMVEAVLLLLLFARLAPITGVIVAERRGVGAFARAFHLTRGLTWKLVGVVVLYAIVTFVSVLAARTVFGSILGLLTSREGSISVAGVLTAVIVAAVSTCFTVLAAAFCAKLYVAVARSAEPPLPHAPYTAA